MTLDKMKPKCKKLSRVTGKVLMIISQIFVEPSKPDQKDYKLGLT